MEEQKREEFVSIITDKGRKKKVLIPLDVPDDKIGLFQEYAQANYNWEHLVVKRFKASNGKTYSLPLQNMKLVLKLLPTEEAKELQRADREARSALGTLNAKRNKLYGSPSKKVERSLFDENSTKVLEWLGKGWTAQEVHKQLLLEGIDVPMRAIIDFQNKNKDQVVALRSQWNQDLQDVPLTSKRSRLEKLSYLYHEISGDFENCKTPSLKSNLSKELRGILDQARKEVEGEELKLTIDGNIDVNATINVAMSSARLLHGLTVNQLIISRVAARLKLPSQYLIDRLAHSYYAKYNGYRTNDDLKTKPIYPTSVQYDILSEEMVRKNEKWEREQKEYEDAVVITEPSPAIIDTREQMKKALRKKLGIE